MHHARPDTLANNQNQVESDDQNKQDNRDTQNVHT